MSIFKLDYRFLQIISLYIEFPYNIYKYSITLIKAILNYVIITSTSRNINNKTAKKHN